MQSNLFCSEQYNPCRWIDQRYGLDVFEIDVSAIIYELGSHEKTINMLALTVPITATGLQG